MLYQLAKSLPGPVKARMRRGLNELVRARIIRWSGGKIAGGPFAGMRYVGESVGSQLFPKLCGTYERELASVWTQLKRIKPALLIDVGAAEGYYAIGALYAGFVSKVIAYERDPAGRALIQRLATLNSIDPDTIDVREACDCEALSASLAGGEGPLFVIMDVEGEEAELLDPTAVPGLRPAYILVEMHDAIPTDRMIDRWRDFHDILRIDEKPRMLSDVPVRDAIFRRLPKELRLLAISEARPQLMHWLWMVPKISGLEAHRGQN